jgi:hypothetical protein
VLTVAAVFAIGSGWLVRLAARPRTTRAALAAAAATGLVATLVAFSMLGPQVGAEAWHLRFLRLHPVSDPVELGGRPGRADLPAAEADYLAQYLPLEGPLFCPPEDRPARLRELHSRAVLTNRFYAGVTLGWVVLFVVLVFFLGLTLSSTWAADYLMRSGQGPIAIAVCHLEMYLPVAALLVWCDAIVLFLGIFGTMNGIATWGQLLAPVGFGVGWVGLAHTGVIQQWHLAKRGAMYLAFIGLAVAVWAIWVLAS